MKKETAVKVALGFFSLAAAMGLVLRLAFSVDLPPWLSFSYIRHAHSHVALLGWLFAGFFLLIVEVWEITWSRQYQVVYICLQVAVAGMAVTFPVTGYDTLSILFSSLHIIFSYAAMSMLWVDSKQKSAPSNTLLRTSLVFLFIASLGTWSLGPLMSSYKGSSMYYIAIQWYLHFMFNGWMVFAMFAILFKYLEQKQIHTDTRLFRAFYLTLTISALLTFALAVTWSIPVPALFLVNSIGVLIQIISLVLLLAILKQIYAKIAAVSLKETIQLLFISLFALALKILIQAAVVIPFIAKASYTIKNFVIGFVHLLMLACFSLFILALIRQTISVTWNRKAVFLLLTGIILTEILLFSQGMLFWLSMGFIPAYYHLMTFGSLCMVAGIWWILLSLKQQKNNYYGVK